MTVFLFVCGMTAYCQPMMEFDNRKECETWEETYRRDVTDQVLCLDEDHLD